MELHRAEIVITQNIQLMERQTTQEMYWYLLSKEFLRKFSHKSLCLVN